MAPTRYLRKRCQTCIRDDRVRQHRRIDGYRGTVKISGSSDLLSGHHLCQELVLQQRDASLLLQLVCPRSLFLERALSF